MSVTGGQTSRVRALVVALAVGGLGIGVASVLGRAIVRSLAFLDIELSALGLLVISLITGQGVAFGSAALLYLRFRGLGRTYLGIDVPSLRDVVTALSGYALALIAQFVGSILLTVVGVQPAENQIGQIAAQNPELLLLLIPASFIIIGPGEELLFRGIVQGRLRESFGPVPGVVLASAVFAAIHFQSLTGGVGGRLATITVLFLPSLVFGAAYEVSDNLVVPAFIHGAYNATLFTLLYFVLQADLPVSVLF
ncbi:CPBP family intramembrane glutamic endopeptidase [Halococcus qingdaonensis]|uniref:CPBP family intramembrane glutamic endopeptidase n=1 Tax=Halococcus qingdaonensis TaxID=224402 RepID=UPI00211678E4|nr:type II CAAX endopeptidase family protein [Halococcus qingdaonensis]